jgi:hypothetical protein
MLKMTCRGEKASSQFRPFETYSNHKNMLMGAALKKSKATEQQSDVARPWALAFTCTS